MSDNRFKTPGVDSRFSSPGSDVRFATPGVDARFQDGVDTRFEGDTYGSISPISGTAPVLAALDDGDTLSTAVTWGSYASTAGTITDPTTKEMSVNGAAFVAYNGATVVSADDTYQLRETVTDSAGTPPRAFTSGTVTVLYIAPVAAGALPDVSYSQDSGVQTVNAAADFTGAVGGTWSVSGAGASIDASGVVSIPTTALLAGVVVTVTYTNSGGAANSAFQVTVTEVDTTAPAFTAFTVGPQVDNTLPTSITVGEDPSTPFTAYIVGVATGASAPSAAQIVAGTDAADAAAPIVSSVSFSASGTTTDSIADPASGTYDFYAVVADAADNLSVVRSSLAVVYTAPAPSGYTITGTPDGILIENAATLTVAGTSDGITLEAA